MTDAAFIKEHNARHLWHPMAHPAEMRAHPPKVFVSAEGVELTDVDGHRVLDAVGGLWNVNLGYSCQPIKDAIYQQLNTLPYYSSFRGTSTDVLVELSVMLVDWFKPEGMARSFFTSGGSDSVETALKLARQYHKVRGDRDRVKFIGLRKGYHGTHFGGASVNGNANFRRNYEPMMPGVFHIPAPWDYRNPFDETDPEKIARLCANLLEEEIQFQNADTVAAFIMEPVLGAGGVIVPHETFMPMVREICDRYGVLLIADEVITAFGRTGAWTGSRLWGVQPDLLCFAKAITNGYFPFGGVMINEKLVDDFENNQDGFGSIGHGYTYSGHPTGCAAALATLKETERLQVARNARDMGALLQSGLKNLQMKYSVVGNSRGVGLMGAMEMVSHPDKKTPAGKDTVQKFFEATYEAGVMVRVSGNNIIASPPLVINEADVSRMISAFDIGLAAAS
ncbi:MAG: putrescine aminotransferase [Parasphingorhabdus sp.]|jgi:putrescine aminotransferase